MDIAGTGRHRSAVSGVVHLVKPEVYEPLMPTLVPAHREVILASGVARAGLRRRAAAPAHPPRRRLGQRRAAGRGLPGNLKMADDARRSRNTRFKAAAFARLPLQLPLIRAALKAARG